MTILFFKKSLASIAITTSLLNAVYIPQNSTIVTPQQMIMHIEDAYWLDENNIAYSFLKAPVDIDIASNYTINLIPALDWIRSHNITPVSLVIKSKRHFETIANAFLEGITTHAHTHTNFPEINYNEISHICLASQTAEAATIQKCWMPESTSVNSELSALGIESNEGGSVSYILDASELISDIQQANILINAGRIEFGTGENKHPIVVMAHLPQIILQSSQEATNETFLSENANINQAFVPLNEQEASTQEVSVAEISETTAIQETNSLTGQEPSTTEVNPVQDS